MSDLAASVASRFLQAASHRRSVALMKFLAGVANRLGVGSHVYVVGGAVRDFVLSRPIKDVDVVVDSVALGGKRDSAWFAEEVRRAIPMTTNVVTNTYGVVILSVHGTWILDGEDLDGEQIEIANARKESYSGAGGKGKGYKPDEVVPATIQDDVSRRELTFNTLLWRLSDLVDGPEKAEIVDLTGCGLQDLRDGVLRCPRDPDIVLRDDPTRILRVLKFMLRYGFRLPVDLEGAIRRNVSRLKDMPFEAVGIILVRDILDNPKAREGLQWMKTLGIIDVLAEMIQTIKPFASFMAGQISSGDRDVQLLLDMAELGLSDKPVSFLTPAQRVRLREITISMSREEATAFLGELRQPALDNMSIIEEFALEPRERGLLAPTARMFLLERPILVEHPDVLNAEVRANLRQVLRR